MPRNLKFFEYLLLSLCFLFIPFSLWFLQAYKYYSPLLLVAVLLLSIVTKLISSRAVKVLCYASLGFVSYWVVGNAFFVPLGQEAMLFSFIPFMFLAGVNAIAVLIAYIDGYTYGGVFAATSIISLLLTTGPLDFTSIDRFMISSVLFAFSSFVFVHYLHDVRKTWEAVYALIKAIVISAVFLTLIFTVRIFGIDMLFSGDASTFASRAEEILAFVAWVSAVSNGFFVSLALLSHQVVAYSLELRREVSGEEVTYRKIGRQALENGEEEADEDIYEPLILSLKKFIQDIKDYDKETADETIKRFEGQLASLSMVYDSKSKDKAIALIAVAKKMSKGISEETERAPPALPSFAKKEAIELPAGSTLLVEGPIGSRKEEFCLKFLKAEIERGNNVAICSYEPEKEADWFNGKERERIELVRVEPNITEMALDITAALENRPKIIYFNVLFHLMPAYNENVLSDFLSATFKKIKKSGCVAIFVVEKEMPSQVLPVIESLFDGVIEFQIKEEDDKLNSYYRIKEFKFKKFDTNWNKFK